MHDLKASAAKDAQALGWYSEVGLGSEAGYGAAWLPDNTIVYGRMLGGLWRMPVSGGAPVQVTKDLPEGELAHRLPQALPGGRSVLMTVIRDTLASGGESRSKSWIWHRATAGASCPTRRMGAMPGVICFLPGKARCIPWR